MASVLEHKTGHGMHESPIAAGLRVLQAIPDLRKVPPERLEAARRFVATHAVDAEDEALLLAMLGLAE